MNVPSLLVLPLLGILAPRGAVAPPQHDPNADLAFLSWTGKECEKIGEAMHAKGRVGGFFDTRILGTNQSYNYKLRATWLTPEVIRAAARLKQLELGLSNDETIALVTKAESIGDTLVMVEIDPREGSGVIPREWVALLRPQSGDGKSVGVRGINHPKLRNVKAVSGTKPRDYAYDVFWLSFSLLDNDGRPLLPDTVSEAELVVRIRNKEGRVSWKIPPSIRRKTLEVETTRENR